jgi:hypothetical protein
MLFETMETAGRRKKLNFCKSLIRKLGEEMSLKRTRNQTYQAIQNCFTKEENNIE